MGLIANRKGISFQIFFGLFLGLCIAYLSKDMNWLLMLGVSGIVVLLIIASRNLKHFILVLLAIKPFVDLTWQVKFFSIGGIAMNPLRITGILVLVVVGYLYFVERDRRRLFNERIIWIFLGLNIFSSVIALISLNRSFISCADILVRTFDAYLIYFVFHRFMNNDTSVQRVIAIIWISTLLVSMVSVLVYATGSYNIDISQGVERFAGLYNDPGGPAFNVIISLMFGTLYVEIYKKQNISLSFLIKMFLLLTIIATLVILIITVTKSAFVMCFAFLIMWLGLYKRKLLIVIPMIALSIYFMYSHDERLQMRAGAEREFVEEGINKGEFTIEAARPIGEGRVAHWERLLMYYDKDYNVLEKLFGTSRTFAAHNQYIAFLMQVGLIGLTVFVMILFRFYKELIQLYSKYKKPEVYMAITHLTVFVIYGLTGHPFYYTTLLWYLMILLSLLNMDRSVRQLSQKRKEAT